VAEGLAVGEAEPVGAGVAATLLAVDDDARLDVGVDECALAAPLAGWPDEPHAATSSTTDIAATPVTSRA
jgi:hypothetical protein